MKRLRINPLLAAMILCTLVAAGCGDDNNDNNNGMGPGAETFTVVDRMGMPAIATAVITSKDAYNADTPAGDVAGNWVGEITTNVTELHNALDDDLTGLGLTPATPGEAVAQAAPFVVPDVLMINTGAAAGFPNGRGLGDQVIDVTLALVLLDIDLGNSAGPHTAVTLAGVPVNPTANDKAFSGTFPYLATPHTP